MSKLFLFFYVIFLLSFTFFSYFFIDQNLFYLHRIYSVLVISDRYIKTILLALFFLGFTCFYLYFLFLEKKGKMNNHQFWSLVILTVVCLAFSYPAVTSFDIFNYIATAKVTYFYHENPYIIMPIEFLNDPLLLFMHAANKTALYAPLWILLTAIPYFLGLNNFILTMLSFKFFIIVFYVLTIIILQKLLKEEKGVIFFAFNPVVVFETLVGSHNDIVMVFFVLLGFLLVFKRRYVFGLLGICFSILIKYATIFLFPVLLYFGFVNWKKKKIDFDKIYLYSFVCMFIIFLLSSLREEIYPWYALWFLCFACLMRKRPIFHTLLIIFSVSLLGRYFPYMILLTHFGITPFIKTVITFGPSLISLPVLYYANKHKI